MLLYSPLEVRIAVSYTNEEYGLIDGIITSYLISHSASTDVKVKYSTVREHLCKNILTKADLERIKNALYFALPIFESDRNMSKEIISAIAATNVMIKGAA